MPEDAHSPPYGKPIILVQLFVDINRGIVKMMKNNECQEIICKKTKKKKGKKNSPERGIFI